MIAGKVEGFTRSLGAPKGWNPGVEGPCVGLPIRDSVLDGTDRACMVSAWELTDDERARIGAGAMVELCVVGIVHPPVGLTVGAAPGAVHEPLRADLLEVSRGMVEAMLRDIVENSERLEESLRLNAMAILSRLDRVRSGGES